MSYSEKDIQAIVEAQRAYFRTGATMDTKWRIDRLKELRDAVMANEEAFAQALAADLGRSRVEAYLCDIVPLVAEINEMIRGLRKWARPERHFSGLMCFPSIVTKVFKMPYGVTLVISPFNFPILLTLGVVAASICGGNTVVIKASAKSTHCTAALKKFIADVFHPEYVTLVDGGHDVADMCLDQRWDKIFYTGSPAVGKHVLEKAAPNLTPVALELGGETGNWCVVRKDADIKDAARKIAFFKLCNAGQICININQVAVAEEIAPSFLEALKAEFIRQIGDRPQNNEDYPHLITSAAYDKCASVADEYRDRIVFGGEGDPRSLRYAPTVIYPVGIDEPIVNKELFCPLLPIVPFKDSEVNALMDTIASREHPLAMYLFTADKRWAWKMMSTHQYGGGCINEVCIHLMVKGVPFGGTGHSGMGAYHGEWGFREFTHPCTVLQGSTRFNLPLREHPYSGKSGETKLKILRFFERCALMIAAFVVMMSCAANKTSDKEYTGYLFAHMTSGDYGSLYYSLSRDGKSWTSINDGNVVLDGYLGHPNIARGIACGPDDDFASGECFYMMGMSTTGALRYPILWYSRDLIDWHHKDLKRDDFEVAAFGYENESVYLGAPKIFFDEDNSRYMVTWHAYDSTAVGNNPLWESMRTFYVLTSDWVNFTEPQRLFDFDGDDASMATIDVILYKEGGKYYAAIKDERWPETAPTGKTIRIASSDSLTGPYCNPGPSITRAWEEAPVAVRKNDGSGWFLYTEYYLEARYVCYEADDLSSPVWTPVEISAPEKGRHGCVIPVTEEEYQKLLKRFAI